MTSIKVLYLITELDTGGSQTALLRLLSGIDRERYQPLVACFYNGNGPPARWIRDLGISVVDLHMPNKARWDALLRLYALIQREKPVLLHTWLYHANLAGRLVGRAGGVPILITSRRNTSFDNSFREKLLRWTAGLDDCLITVCEAARQLEILANPRHVHKIIAIYNGLDPERFICVTPERRQGVRHELGIPPDAHLIGTVGRLHSDKGIDVLLRAIPAILERQPDARFLIVGEGQERANLENLAQRLGIQDMVLMPGSRSDIPEILSALDLFVSPSLREGLSNSILEAMAAGLPVVATNTGGTPELVLDGISGLLVPAGQPDPLAQTLASLIEDPIRRSELGKAGRERAVQQFSINRMVQKTETLYSDLLAQKGIGH